MEGEWVFLKQPTRTFLLDSRIGSNGGVLLFIVVPLLLLCSLLFSMHHFIQALLPLLHIGMLLYQLLLLLNQYNRLDTIYGEQARMLRFRTLNRIDAESVLSIQGNEQLVH
ncbi:hypothetical protein ACOME3_005828 [Neoechinorhynchus agilis]